MIAEHNSFKDFEYTIYPMSAKASNVGLTIFWYESRRKMVLEDIEESFAQEIVGRVLYGNFPFGPKADLMLYVINKYET